MSKILTLTDPEWAKPKNLGKKYLKKLNPDQLERLGHTPEQRARRGWREDLKAWEFGRIRLITPDGKVGIELDPNADALVKKVLDIKDPKDEAKKEAEDKILQARVKAQIKCDEESDAS